jgi:hypothetical protein
MKGIVFLTGILVASSAFAIEPVTLSGPVPPLAQIYAAGSPQTVVYTITNQVPKSLPIQLGGISGPVTRTSVANDCGNTLPSGPASCNIGIQIAPIAAGTSINQTLQINFDGRAPLTSPISFLAVQPLAYVTPGPNADTIYTFLLDTASGEFTTIGTAYSSLSQSFDALTFATVGGVQYGYVLDQNGFVYQCTINAGGDFDACTATPPTPQPWNPHGIAFATVNGIQYAYVTDVNVGNVYQCSLNVGGPSNGTFNACSNVVSSAFNAPYGITFGTVNGVQYAYIADSISSGSSTGNVYQCTLDVNGFFTACNPTPVPPHQATPPWIPYSVTFATVDGTQYAYVADNGTATLPVPNGNVYQCTLTSGGLFDTCTSTIAAPATAWVPDAIAFATLNGTQYAYVASYQGPIVGGMDWCTLNIDGTFAACKPTPASPPAPWQPVGIAFRFN